MDHSDSTKPRTVDEMKTFKIKIGDSACFGDESAEFVSYLNNLGYDAEETNSGGNYIDGWKSDNEECPLDLDQLWGDYCNA